MPTHIASTPTFGALLFDLDGTLVDSEPQTDQAIAEVLRTYGEPNLRLPPAATRGRSWQDIAATIMERVPSVSDGVVLAAQLLAHWRTLTMSPTPVAGVPAAVRGAAERFRLGVVSSSPRAVIDHCLQYLGLDGCIPPAARIGADQISRHKPHPDGWLLAAQRLGVSPAACVVFEDSSAGLRAAAAAGMARIAVLQHSAEAELCQSLADAAIPTFAGLQDQDWAALAAQGPVAWRSKA